MKLFLICLLMLIGCSGESKEENFLKPTITVKCVWIKINETYKYGTYPGNGKLCKIKLEGGDNIWRHACFIDYDSSFAGSRVEVNRKFCDEYID